MEKPVAPLIIRGEVITDHLVEMGGRGGDLTFLAPDPHHYCDRLPLGNPTRLADLYELSFEDILDYAGELARRLEFASNGHMQRACELSYLTAPSTPSIVKWSYLELPKMLDRKAIIEAADATVGIRHLEGWVRQKLIDGTELEIRCFGARTLHIVAGNSPGLSLLTILRNMILRSDAIIKAPSNDPFTAIAIARTMIDMAPTHPLTRHLSVGYWKGGDTAFEERLYRPENLEKIVAWGGLASVRHVTRYIQPGLELISLDPKRSASIIGRATFASDVLMREAALRLASDIGGANQNACVNARLAYLQCGTDADGLVAANRFGRYVYEALLALPNSLSTPARRYDPQLKAQVDSLRLVDEWYQVIGGQSGEGAVIVSQLSDPVPFAAALADRTANLVPVDRLDQVFDAVDSYTQTVGIYPESLKDELKDRLSLHGAQRIVSLGYAMSMRWAAPQDAIEPLRRMGKWISNQISSPATVPGPWQRPKLS